MTSLEEKDSSPIADPLADLMFTMMSVVLLALVLLAPALAQGARGASSGSDRTLAASYELDGAHAVPVIATRSGVEIPARDGSIALDDILSSARLHDFLSDLGTRKDKIILAVDPDGGEAAFQLEGLLARAAPRDIYEMRSATSCFSFAGKQTARRACGRTDHRTP